MKSEIKLWLDSYDDIFSDFDPRPYSKKALSEDFISELKKASMDKEEGNIIIELQVPEKKRNLKDESLIKHRLREHFGKHYLRIKHKIKGRILMQGIMFVTIGLMLMIAATLMLFKYEQKTMLSSFLVILLEPAAWFLFWEGLNLIIFETRKINPELEFYEKMQKSTIHFASY